MRRQQRYYSRLFFPYFMAGISCSRAVGTAVGRESRVPGVALEGTPSSRLQVVLYDPCCRCSSRLWETDCQAFRRSLLGGVGLGKGQENRTDLLRLKS